MKINWTEQITISALHNLENPDISDLENEKLYGMCFRTHGHDYQIQIEMQALVDANTGVAVDRVLLKNILQVELFDKFNGTFLNDSFDCTSGEALAVYFFKLLRGPIESKLSGCRLHAVHIQETRKNWFSYS